MQIDMLKAASFIVALILTGPALSQTLEDILAPRPDTSVCWERIYTDAHLAKHPRQKVTKVSFGLFYYEMEHHEAGKGNYSFSIDFTTRERTGGAGGQCFEDDQGKVTCGGDCDSGGLTIRNSGSKGSLLVELTSGGMTLTDCGEDSGYFMSAEPDDKLFLVHPVACPPDW